MKYTAINFWITYHTALIISTVESPIYIAYEIHIIIFILFLIEKEHIDY